MPASSSPAAVGQGQTEDDRLRSLVDPAGVDRRQDEGGEGEGGQAERARIGDAPGEGAGGLPGQGGLAGHRISARLSTMISRSDATLVAIGPGSFSNRQPTRPKEPSPDRVTPRSRLGHSCVTTHRAIWLSPWWPKQTQSGYPGNGRAGVRPVTGWKGEHHCHSSRGPRSRSGPPGWSRCGARSRPHVIDPLALAQHAPRRSTPPWGCRSPASPSARSPACSPCTA